MEFLTLSLGGSDTVIQQWDSGLVQWSEWMAVNVLVILGWLALVMLVIIMSISSGLVVVWFVAVGQWVGG